MTQRDGVHMFYWFGFCIQLSANVNVAATAPGIGQRVSACCTSLVKAVAAHECHCQIHYRGGFCSVGISSELNISYWSETWLSCHISGPLIDTLQ